MASKSGPQAPLRATALTPHSFPERSWIREYLEMINNMTEAPWLFHIMGAFAAMGAIFGRSTRLPWGTYTLYGPCHVLWLGPSGCGKTQSFGLALDVIKCANPSLVVVKNEATPVGIITRVGDNLLKLEEDAALGGMALDSEFVFAAGEMKTLVNVKRDSEGLLPMLTDMMDCPATYERTTVARGVDIVSKPTPTAMMCSTQEWLQDMAPTGIFEGGFMSRVIPIVARGKARVLPRPKLLDPAKLTAMGLKLQKLHRLLTHGGTTPIVFELNPRVMAWYEQWYEAVHAGPPVDKRLTGWQSRLHAHLLRLAMLLSLSRAWVKLGKEKPQILVQDLVLADRLLGQVAPGLKALMQVPAGTGFGALRQQVEALVRHHGPSGITKTTMLSRVPCSWEELDKVLETLTKAKVVRVASGTKEAPEAIYSPVE